MSLNAETFAVDRKAATAASAGLGATLAAVLATACCVPILAPLIVAVLGVSGSIWAAGLKPYSPYILIGSLAVLAYGFWIIYRPCEMPEGASCASRKPRTVVWMIWIAALFWTLALAINALPELINGLARILDRT